METRAHHILIGLFTLIVFALGLAFVLWLTNHGRDRSFTEYDVIFHETVTGLSKGSAVQYSGIAIGEVIRLRLDPADPRKVIARIRVSGRSPLRKDTQAKLGFAGITGVGFIQMSGGTPHSALLEPVGDQDVAQVDASPSDLARLQASGADILVSVNEAVNRIKDVLAPENTEHLGSMLRNADQIVASVNAQRDSLGSALQQLSATTQKLNGTLNSVDTAAGSITSLMNRDARQVITAANQTLDSVNKLVANADGLVADGRGALTGFSQQGLHQVGPTLEELRVTLASLQRLSDQLARSDSAVLGNPQPKEFHAR